MIKTFKLFSFFFLLVLIGFTSSCKKPVFLSKGNLSFSKDTVVFDTVFTTIGSTTQQFKIYNNENKTVLIEDIQLMGGENSPFRINVDGVPGLTMADIELEGNDSLFAFVEVTLDVNGQNLPMVIEDSIRFRTNGKDQYVILAAWGQDMYYHYSNFQNEQFDLNEGTWPNDKPHVIYGAAVVDSAKTLNIQPNTSIYMHKNAILYVYKGTLNINGTKDNEVIIQGDRLEADYDDVTGQFYGVYFQEARPSAIDYAIIKNGISGVHLFSKDQSFASSYTLKLTNTKISNQARYGVFIYSGARVKAENCIISKNGTHALLVLEGGDFNFNHCDLLGYGTSQSPAVGISNFYNDYANGTQNIGSINEGVIYNSIIYGGQISEIAFDTIPDAMVTLSFDIKNCLIKREPVSTSNYYSNIFWNNNPLFTSVTNDDYSFAAGSVLNSNGFVTSVDMDINGIGRGIPPDIGAIETP
ncbi:MAG: right-handed parallel beta-helix repeat-containing protein [Crocinitomicaceae bacterium]|nr:right-handed parallel beta-helix repeat-containing protein [Crocinitomicaceae bacterium]